MVHFLLYSFQFTLVHVFYLPCSDAQHLTFLSPLCASATRHHSGFSRIMLLATMLVALVLCSSLVLLNCFLNWESHLKVLSHVSFSIVSSWGFPGKTKVEKKENKKMQRWLVIAFCCSVFLFNPHVLGSVVSQTPIVYKI